MRLYLTAKTSIPDLFIDYIQVKLKSGEEVSLNWDYSDPETAVVGVGFHVFEWLFVRLAPIILIGAIVGIFLTRKKV